jgi:SAM-dependent methyltransferase
MNRRQYWDSIYQSKVPTEVSWFEADPQLSVDLIASVSNHGPVIDVGGGASRLVERLVADGYSAVTVVDVSKVALQQARGRLGERAANVRWIHGDITQIPELPQCDVWHDRAVFHFLTNADDRRRYRELAMRTITPGGHAIVGTFAMNGPSKCSGLDVCRYDAPTLQSELGPHFELIREVSHTHLTPTGNSQPFFFGVFRFTPLHRTTATNDRPAKNPVGLR